MKETFGPRSSVGAGVSEKFLARILEAIVLVVMDELNILRAEHALPPRNKAQILPAIRAKIDAMPEK